MVEGKRFHPAGRAGPVPPGARAPMSSRPPRGRGGCPECPAREVVDRVGDKWSVFVIALLRPGPRRFTELLRSIDGISHRMLTMTLRGLERDGLVTRTVTPSIPPRVDYALTPLGRTLLDPIMALAAWAEKNAVRVNDARRRYDARASARAPRAPARPRHAAVRRAARGTARG